MARLSLALPVGAACLGPACALPGAELLALLPDERLAVDLPAGPEAAAPWVVFLAEGCAPLDAVALWVPERSAEAARLAGEEDGAGGTTWGPWQEPGGGPTTRLRMAEASDNGRYTFVFEQWSTDGAEADAAPIAGGEVAADRGTEAREGWVDLDFSAARRLAPATGGPDGRARLSWSLGAAGDRVEADLMALEAASGDQRWALTRAPGAGGRLDLEAAAALAGAPGPVGAESFELVARWAGSGAGRLDLEASGGDLGAGALTVGACWDADGEPVWTDEGAGAPAGDEADCALGPLEEEAAGW
jgi:hypothetical protein